MEEFGQRVGAVVTLTDDQSSNSTTPDGRKLLLEDLRRDLMGKLISYKLSTLLRVMNGELPKAKTGEVLKRCSVLCSSRRTRDTIILISRYEKVRS
jgi:acyl-CoA synthetase (AMP-forming)/AMP-acid ligase II